MGYYRLDRADIYKDYNFKILVGTRSPGKSYAVKERIIEEAVNKKRFVYVRRYEMETKGYMVEPYFEDMTPVIEKYTDGKANTMLVDRRRVYFGKMDEEGKKTKVGEYVGSVVYLAGQHHFKSLMYPKTGNMIFEEFITDEGYLDDEPKKLMSLISTVCRQGECTVYLIGNTMTRSCPYFWEWALKGVPTMPVDSIGLYQHEQQNADGSTSVVKIYVEHCAPPDKVGAMYIGEPTITQGGWTSHEQPRFPFPLTDCEKLYTMYLKVGFLGYTLNVVITPEKDVLLYINPTKPELFKTHIRVLTSEWNSTSLYQVKLRDDIKGQAIIRKLISMEKWAFSDNLTGEEFKQYLKEGVIK